MKLTFSCYGARIGVCCDSKTLLSHLVPILPPASHIETIEVPDAWFEVEQIGAGRFRLFREGEIDALELDQTGVLQQLQSLFHDCVAQNAREFLFVHAGVVAWENAAAIFPGRTMSGKTTLVAALVRAGARYLSDEFAVLTKDGLVSPYAKPLSVRNGNGQVTLTPVGEIGGEAATRSFPAKLVVKTAYMPGSIWQPEPLSPGQTLMALLDNTVAVRSVPKFTMKLLGQVVRGTTGFAGPRGEADQFVHQLRVQLDKLGK